RWAAGGGRVSQAPPGVLPLDPRRAQSSRRGGPDLARAHRRRTRSDLRLHDQPCASLAELQQARAAEDARMIRLADGYAEADLATKVRYRTIVRPETVDTPLHLCWLHLFNHQTHHRGQVHDQLSQTDVAPPPLDLSFYLRETDARQ